MLQKLAVVDAVAEKVVADELVEIDELRGAHGGTERGDRLGLQLDLRQGVQQLGRRAGVADDARVAVAEADEPAGAERPVDLGARGVHLLDEGLRGVVLDERARQRRQRDSRLRRRRHGGDRLRRLLLLRHGVVVEEVVKRGVVILVRR